MGVATTANKSVVFFSSLGSFTFGYMLSAVSGLLGLNSFLSYFDIDTGGVNAVYAARMQGGELPPVTSHLGSLLTPLSSQWGGVWSRRCRGLRCGLACGSRREEEDIPDHLRYESHSDHHIHLVDQHRHASSRAHHHRFEVSGNPSGRLVAEGSCGMLHTLCPVYQSEVSSAHNRGVMVGMHGFM